MINTTTKSMLFYTIILYAILIPANKVFGMEIDTNNTLQAVLYNETDNISSKVNIYMQDIESKSCKFHLISNDGSIDTENTLDTTNIVSSCLYTQSKQQQQQRNLINLYTSIEPNNNPSNKYGCLVINNTQRPTIETFLKSENQIILQNNDTKTLFSLISTNPKKPKIVKSNESSTDSTDSYEENNSSSDVTITQAANLTTSDVLGTPENSSEEDLKEEPLRFNFIEYKIDSLEKKEEAKASKIKNLKEKMIETLKPENKNRPGAIHFYVRPFLKPNYNLINNFSVLKFQNFIDTESIKKVTGFEKITSEIMEENLKYEESYVSVEIFKDQPDYKALEDYLTENPSASVVAHYQDTKEGEIYCRILSPKQFNLNETAQINLSETLATDKQTETLFNYSIHSKKDQNNSKKSYVKAFLRVGGAIAVFIFMAHYFNLLPDIMMTNLHSLFNKLQTLPTRFFTR